MFTTVVGSFPVEFDKKISIKDKFLDIFGKYDPYKSAIKNAVIKQLDAGIDIISDGQVRGDMISSFTNFVPGMKVDRNNTVIVSKIKKLTHSISINDLNYAKSIMKNYYNGKIPKNKGIKGIITGPSTIIHSSRIKGYYKDKNNAIIDLAESLKNEVQFIEKYVNPKYIQIDEPFLSTGIVDFKTARKAINIIKNSTSLPIAIHICGDLSYCFKQLSKFNVDILDFEFAGNSTNLDILKNEFNLVKNKKIGFGCIDTSTQTVDLYEDVKDLVNTGIEIIGRDNIIFDPDCGLKRSSPKIAFEKLKIMNKVIKNLT